MGAKRILLLKVPLDIVPPEELPEVIYRLIQSSENSAGVPGGSAAGKGRDIVLLSLWDLLRARRNGEYRNYVLNAALVIPISKSLVSGAKFLTGEKVNRYMPFNFVISILSLLEKQEGTLYLLGAESRVLKKAEKNIRSTFPQLGIVGRCPGFIRKQEEPWIVEAIRKVSPSLLLVGKGVRGKELWIARNGSRLNTGFRLWCSDLFDIFSEKRRRPSDAVFNRGLESIAFFMGNPLRLFRFFVYIRYKFLLLFYKIVKSRAA